MKAQIEALRDRWEELSVGKQRGILIGAILFVLLAGYLIFVIPVQSKVATLEAANAKLAKEYNIIAAYNPSQTNKGPNRNPSDIAASVESAIDKASRNYNLQVAKMNKSGNGVSIDLPQITDAVTIFFFLDELERKYGVYTQSIDIEPQPNDQIKVRRITLGRTAAK